MSRKTTCSRSFANRARSPRCKKALIKAGITPKSGDSSCCRKRASTSTLKTGKKIVKLLEMLDDPR